MAFPSDRLPVKVFLAPGADLTDSSAGWVWTDITSSARLRPGIRLTHGRADESARVAPSTCRLMLDNRSGDFTPRNPLGQWYGQLGRNTPLRVAIRRAEDDFDRTASSGWGTEPLWGGTWTTSGGSASDYSVSSGKGNISSSTTNVRRLSLLDIGVTDARITVDTVNPVVPTGASISHWVIGRSDGTDFYAARLDITTTGSVNLLLFRLAAGLGVTLVTASAIGTHSAGDTWRIVFEYVGTALRAKAWEPSGTEPSAWQVDTTDTTLTAGTQCGAGVRLESGNTSGTQTVTFDDFTVDVDRFSGFVSSWPPRWDKSGNDATVPIEANGVLRRLQQGQTLRSPLYRSISADSTQPIAYWPLEDGIDSTQAGSGLPAGTPMTARTGIMDFVETGPAGSAGSAQPDVDAGNNLLGAVTGGSDTAWQVSVWTRGELVPGAVGFAYYLPVEVRTSNGKILRLFVQSDPNVDFALCQYDSETQTTETNFVVIPTGVAYSLQDNNWHLLQATFAQVGADVQATIYLDGTTSATDTWNGLTLGAPVMVNAIGDFSFSTSYGAVSGQMQEIAIAHIGVWNTTTQVDQYQAGLGYAGEAAHTRASRLCSQEGIQYASSATSSETMGPQPVGPLLELLQECAEADQGVLFESGFGLGYLSRAERYNRAVDLPLDFDAGQVAEPPEPTDDDQTLRNRWTVRRRDGSRATAEDSGSIAAVGLYDDETTVNVELDTVLYDHAAWRVHLGT